jgi:hypothetical protein
MKGRGSSNAAYDWLQRINATGQPDFQAWLLSSHTERHAVQLFHDSSFALAIALMESCADSVAGIDPMKIMALAKAVTV